MKTPRRIHLAFLTVTFAATSPLHAQINRWTGTTSGNWNTGSNWANSSVPNGTGVDVVFNSNGLNQSSLNLSANTTIRSKYLYGGNYTLSPSAAETLTVQGGGFTQLGSGTFTVNNNILGVVNNDFNYNGTGTGAITLNGTINNLAQRWDKFNESDVILTNVYSSTSVSANAVRVRAGSLILSGAGSIDLSGTGAQITVGAISTFNAGVFHNNANAALVLDNTGTNNTTRISDGNQINTSVRSLIDLKGNASSASSETLGIFNASGPGNQIRVSNGIGQSSRLTFNSLRVNNAAGNIADTNGSPTVHQFLVPAGSTLGAAGASGSRVIFTTAPTLTNGVLRYGVIKDESVGGGANFASYDSSADDGAAIGVNALAAYTTTDINASVAGSNVDVSGGAILTGTRSYNALRITPTEGGQTMDLGANTLQTGSAGAGGLIFSGGFDYAINNASGAGVSQNGHAAYLYINAKTLTINSPYAKSNEMSKAGNGALVINGGFSNSSARHLGVDDGLAADDMTINGPVSGGSQFVKNGWGTLVLGGSGNNSSFTSGVSLVSGTLVLAKTSTTLQNDALGSGAIGMNGGTLSARNHAAVLANRLDLTQVGGGQNASHFAGDQAITFTGLAQGALSSQQSYVVSNDATANITFSGIMQGFSSNNAGTVNSTFNFSGSGTTLVTGVIRNTDPTFTNAATMTTGLSKSGPGLLILQNANTYTGFLPDGSTASTGILGGYLRVDAAGALGTGNLLISEANFSSGMNAVLELGAGNTTFSRNLGTSGVNTVQIGSTSGNAFNNGGFAAVSGTAIVTLNGGTAPVTYGSTGFFSAGGNLILGSPNVAGTLEFQNPIILNGNRTISALNGTAPVDGRITGVLSNGTGTRRLTKIGAGTLELTAQNTYTGSTVVSAGTLLVNNTSGFGLASDEVNVVSGATLGGTGSISGELIAAGTIAPGSNGIGNFTVEQGATLEGSLAIELNANSSDRLVVGNAFGGLDLTNAVLNITALAPAAASNYVIASYTGGFTGNTNAGTADTFASVTGLPSGYSIVHDTVLKQIRLEANVVVNAYDSWSSGFPGFTNSAPAFDFENDGLANLLEFALGGNPTTNDTPSKNPVVSDTGTNLVISFSRSDISETSPLPTTVKVQVSDDLVTWNPANDISIGATGGTGPNGATYTVDETGPLDAIVVTIPKLGAAKKFARVVTVR